MAPVQRLRSSQRARLAIAAVKPAIVRIEQTRARPSYTRCLRNIANAMRPGVVRIEAYTAAEAFLGSQQQPVVTHCAARIELVHETEILAILRVCQVSEAPLAGVGGRVAPGHHSRRARAEG